MKLVMEELAHSGDVAPITPLLLELDAHRITATDDLPEEEFLFRMHGVPCFPRKDLSVITGQAKSGKTFFTSLLMAMGCGSQSLRKSGRLPLIREREEPLRVMWLDTEQSQRCTQDILKNRVLPMTDNGSAVDEHMFVFNVRGVSCEERIELLTEGIVTYRPDLVILDGIRDLVRDINDGVKATEVIERLMRLAEEYNCAMVCVLHQNRSADNRGLRGWLGTELMNKAFEVYACEKQRQQRVFTVQQVHTRKYDMEQALCYTVDDDGLPVVTEKPRIQPRDAQGKSAGYDNGQDETESLNHDYIVDHGDGPWEWDLRRLFGDAMGSRATWTYNDLMAEVMRLGHIKWKQYYYKLFDKAEERRVVKKTMDRCGRVVIMLVPSSGQPAGVAGRSAGAVCQPAGAGCQGATAGGTVP